MTYASAGELIKRLMVDRRVTAVVTVAAVCSWLTLTIISLVPGSERPHTGMSGNAEHMLAYFLASLVTRLAFRHTASRWQLVAFSAASALFEVCQIWIPGRHAGVDNWAASSAGALLGILLARVIAHPARHKAASAP